MPLYSKVWVQQYGEDPATTAQASLSELQHESRRLSYSETFESEGDPSLVYNTPKQWHKAFIEELLRPEEWRAPEGRDPPFKPCDILRLCDLVEARLQAEPTLLEVHAPVKIIGDIHGQFGDLMHLFRVYGTPSRLGDISYLDYLFLGDYVDRGEHSLETISLLFALKVEFPTQVHLLRGNHEISEVNSKYGFLAECKGRLGPVEGWKVWRRINEVFAWLPLAARIDGKILCLHGGISDKLTTCSQIADIQRPLYFDEAPTPSSQLAYQLLWNDPNSTDAVYGSHASSRGSDIQTFSAQQVEAFCEANCLELIVRAHQCVRDGFERFARGRLVTVFSAANYCGRYDNAGALLLVGRDHVVVPKIIRPQPRNPLVHSGVLQFSPREIAKRQGSSSPPFKQQGSPSPARRHQLSPRDAARQQPQPSRLGELQGIKSPRGEGSALPAKAKQQQLSPRDVARQRQQQRRPSGLAGGAAATGAAGLEGKKSPRGSLGSADGSSSYSSSSSSSSSSTSRASPRGSGGSSVHSTSGSSSQPWDASCQQQPTAARRREETSSVSSANSSSDSSRSSRHEAAGQLPCDTPDQEPPESLRRARSHTSAADGRPPRPPRTHSWTQHTQHARGSTVAPAAAPSAPWDAAVPAAAAAAAEVELHTSSSKVKGLPPLVTITARAGPLPDGFATSQPHDAQQPSEQPPGLPSGVRLSCGDTTLSKLREAKQIATVGCNGAGAAAAVGLGRAKVATEAAWVRGSAAVAVGCSGAQAAAGAGAAAGSRSLAKARAAVAVGCAAGLPAAAKARDAAVIGCMGLASGTRSVSNVALARTKTALGSGRHAAAGAAGKATHVARSASSKAQARLQAAAGAAAVGCSSAGSRLRALPMLGSCFGRGSKRDLHSPAVPRQQWQLQQDVPAVGEGNLAAHVAAGTAGAHLWYSEITPVASEGDWDPLDSCAAESKEPAAPALTSQAGSRRAERRVSFNLVPTVVPISPRAGSSRDGLAYEASCALAWLSVQGSGSGGGECDLAAQAAAAPASGVVLKPVPMASVLVNTLQWTGGSQYGEHGLANSGNYPGKVLSAPAVAAFGQGSSGGQLVQAPIPAAVSSEGHQGSRSSAQAVGACWHAGLPESSAHLAAAVERSVAVTLGLLPAAVVLSLGAVAVADVACRASRSPSRAGQARHSYRYEAC
ncbi:hypothetical protein N2152v2_000631 [Parachlorella kessleri]